MKQKKRLFDTLDRIPSDRPVWTADISYWISGNRKTDLASESGYLEYCAELGCMPYYWYDAFWAGERRYSESVTVTRSPFSEKSGEVRTEWQMGSSIYRVDRFSSTSWSEATIKHAVENRSDLKVLIRLIEESELVVSPALESHPSRRKRWEAYDGFPCIGLPRSPLSAFINEWAGVQNGLILLFEEPQLCDRLFSLLQEQEQPLLDACVERNVQLVHFPDNLTSEVYTSIYDDYMRGCYERRLSVLRAGGVRCAVHLDGTVRGLLPKLSDTGLDAVEAVTPHPVGDCTAAEMRAMVEGNGTILWGGVPGAMFANPYTWLDMKRHLDELTEAWRGLPYVLGVADQVPPDGDIDTVRRISDLLS